MADQYATPDSKFFPNLARFVHSCAPGTLTPEQITRIEGGNLFYGERVRVTNLNNLANHWWLVRESLRKSDWGSLFPTVCTDEAWLDGQALHQSSCLQGFNPRYNELSALVREWEALGWAHGEVEERLRAKFADL